MSVLLIRAEEHLSIGLPLALTIDLDLLLQSGDLTKDALLLRVDLFQVCNGLLIVFYTGVHGL